VEFTLATIEDVPELCSLLCELFAQEEEFEPNPEAHKLGLETIISNSEIGTILVARQEPCELPSEPHASALRLDKQPLNNRRPRKIVAMVSLLYTYSTALGARVALLEDMIVASWARRQGIGSELIQFALKVAKTRGVRRVTLMTDANNTPAQRFYLQQGFTVSSMVTLRRVISFTTTL
jgi:ribosomal protein S18 acetylase RimI-like enzyme